MADFQVGQLYRNDGTTPQALQPGGIGTPVTMPAQTDGEKLGLWVFGCGHFFINIDVFSVSIGGVPSALLCCPVCLYIQRIVTPFTDIYNDANFILMG